MILPSSRFPANAMQALDTVSKIRILRRLMETVMWEWNAVKEGRWEELPVHNTKKRDLLKEMSGYDWTPVAAERENAELLILESQIMDLEYQLKKLIEQRMNLISSQLENLNRRHANWKKAVNPYRKMAAILNN